MTTPGNPSSTAQRLSSADASCESSAGTCASPMKRPGWSSLCLVHAVVDQAAGSKVWLIKARAAGEHRNVDARLVHHSNMRR